MKQPSSGGSTPSTPHVSASLPASTTRSSLGERIMGDDAASSAAGKAGDRSGTVRKGLELLELLANYPHGAVAGELVTASGYAFSTCYRLLNTLVDAGFAEFDPRTKRYQVGLRVFQMGQRVATARGFAGSAIPVLRAVTDATGESCILGVPDGDRVLTVHTVDGPHHRVTTDPGDRSELHTSALGRVVLAFSDRGADLLRDLELTARTEHSVRERSTLRQVVADTRARGWVCQDQEHDPGMRAVAVPVLSGDGQLIAALALAAPVHSCSLAELEAHVPALQEAARELAILLPQRS